MDRRQAKKHRRFYLIASAIMFITGLGFYFTANQELRVISQDSYVVSFIDDRYTEYMKEGSYPPVSTPLRMHLFVDSVGSIFSANPELQYSIKVTGDKGTIGKTVKWAIALTGGAQLNNPSLALYRRGADGKPLNPIRVSSRKLVMTLPSSRDTLQPNEVFGYSSYSLDAQIIEGTARVVAPPKNGRFGLYEVGIGSSAVGRIGDMRGAHGRIQGPTFILVPFSTLRAAKGLPGYTPGALTAHVNLGQVPIGAQIVAKDPESSLIGTLRWKLEPTTDYASPSATLYDALKDRKDQGKVFIAGAFLGLATSFLVTLVEHFIEDR